MKTSTSIIVLMTILLACTISAKDQPEGFRNMKFGTVLDSTLKAKMTFTRTDPSYGGIDFYSLDNEKLSIGTTELTSVQYGFWNDTLGFVNIKYKKYYSPIQEVLEKKYGKPYRKNKYITEWHWLNFNNAVSHTWNKYKGGVIRFSYGQLLKTIRKWKKEQTDNAQDDF